MQVSVFWWLILVENNRLIDWNFGLLGDQKFFNQHRSCLEQTGFFFALIKQLLHLQLLYSLAWCLPQYLRRNANFSFIYRPDTARYTSHLLIFMTTAINHFVETRLESTTWSRSRPISGCAIFEGVRLCERLLQFSLPSQRKLHFRQRIRSRLGDNVTRHMYVHLMFSWRMSQLTVDRWHLKQFLKTRLHSDRNST